MFFHDPVRQENYLRQSLAQDKKALGLFIGAGAPMAVRKDDQPLIPDINTMTDIINHNMHSCPINGKAYEKLLEHFSTDGITQPNIEHILSHVRLLKQVAGKDTVRGLAFSELESIENIICGKIVEVVHKQLEDTSTPYHKIAGWISAIHREQPVEIFTTNYDLLMEQALEECRVPYFDGFVGSRLTFFDTQAIEGDLLPPRWARLWKLHGSINWHYDGHGMVTRNEGKHGYSRVIHPSHLKYDESRKMPYLTMIDRLRAFLKKPSSLLIVSGYSFRDQHLNEVIIQGLQGNPTAMVFALQYGSLLTYPEAISIATTRPNLSLLAGDSAIIGTKTAKWLTKNSQDVATIESCAINWVPSPNDGTKKQAVFTLGDFAKLGLFLEDIIGNVGKGE